MVELPRFRRRRHVARRAGGLAGDLKKQRWWRLFTHREYGGLWWSASVSTVGDQFAAIAISVEVYRHTGQPSLTALVYSISLWAPMVGTPTLGALADRWPRRTVMILGASCQALLVGIMAIPGMPLSALAGLLLLTLMVSTPYQAAADAVLAVALEPADYPLGMAMRTTGLEVGQLLGLGSAGALATVFGATPLLAADAVTFLLSAILVSATGEYRPAAGFHSDSAQPVTSTPDLKESDGNSVVGPVRPLTTGGATEPPGERTRAAWFIIRRDPQLRTLLWLRLIAGLAVVPEGVAVALAGQLHAPWAAGLLLAIEPGAVLVGTVILHALADEETRLRLLGPLTVLSVAPLIATIAGPRWSIVVPALVIAGLAASYHVPAGTRWGQIVPNQYRGRVHALARPILRAVQGAGMAGGGVIAGLAGSATAAIAAAGGIGVLLAVPAAVAWTRAKASASGQNSRLRTSATSLNMNGPAT